MKIRTALLALALTAPTVAPAFAGPPLICHIVNIERGASLPWNDSGSWNGMLASYDVAHLAADTLALLERPQSTAVKIETLRRAAIYSSRNPAAADELARRFFAQRDWFSAGYFIEAVRESAQLFGQSPPPFVEAALDRHAGAVR